MEADGYETTGDLNDAIYYERLEVDREQASLEAAGTAYAKLQRRVEALLSDEKFAEAAELCWHGSVGALIGSCTEGDPRHGEEGCRCFECGAHVSDIGGDVLNVR
jgi:hypothetical protein